MTATDELRRLLDERGVEWTEPNNKARSHTTYWTAGFLRCIAVEFNDGMVSIASSSDDITPAQAVEATLGRGTCKVDSFADVRFTEEDNQGHDYEYATLAECSECGAILLMPPPYIWYDENSLYAATNFCPNCGREVTAGAQDDG